VQALDELGYDDNTLTEIPVATATATDADGCFRWTTSCRWGDTTLTMGATGGLKMGPEGLSWAGALAVRYVLRDADGRAVGGFVDAETDYQNGDGETTAYVTADDALVVRNCGDVSSVVVIRRVFPAGAADDHQT